MAWKKNPMWLNGKSYITQDELFGEYQYIINKLSKVLFEDKYFEDTKIFCRSILDFTIDHKFMTWKQANAVLKILTTEERRLRYHKHKHRNPVGYIYCKSNITDKEHDELSRRLFGSCVFQEEMEGYERDYDVNGNRFFSMPSGKHRMSDYI